MHPFFIFVIRAILGSFLAVVAMRIFYPKASIPAVMTVAVLLIGLAYVKESFRKRDKGP